MANGTPPNGLDERINTRGYFERILQEQEKLNKERERRIDERFGALDKALGLQAEEYARRLSDLNGEYRRDQARQLGYVSSEKFEDKLKADAEKFKAEADARATALERVDEKFSEYLKRYEADKREVDLALNAQRVAAAAAKSAAEEQGRKSNRNLGIATLVLGLIVAAANWIGGI